MIEHNGSEIGLCGISAIFHAIVAVFALNTHLLVAGTDFAFDSTQSRPEFMAAILTSIEPHYRNFMAQSWKHRMSFVSREFRHFCADESGTAASLLGTSISSIFFPSQDHVSFRPRKPVSPLPFVAAAGNRSAGYLALKRTLDVAGAVALLTLFSPILISVWAVLMVTTRGKPFFAQERVGECGRRFKMFKFRTMRLDADKLQHLVSNEKDGPIFKNRLDPRITRIGRFLRKTSIDEMPQLLNILRGEMALVGPRPPVPKEVAQYKTWQRRRLSVKPGLTCLWQVSGRSEIGFEDWVRMDIWYVQNQTLWTDVKLLVRTPLTVITGKGAY